MRKTVFAAIALVVLPLAASAQNLNGFYVGLRGGASWLLNGDINVNGTASLLGLGTGALSGTDNPSFSTGWAGGGFVGYDFVGPRIEVEALYHDNEGTASGSLPISGIGTLHITGPVQVRQTSIMANAYYDFFARQAFTPYVGAGAGVAIINTRLGQLTDSDDTEFAYQAIVGAGYKVAPNVRVNLDARYYGTLNTNFNNTYYLPGATVPQWGYISGSYPNNNFSVLASVVFSLGPPSP
jgi:OOP family OmpA-OmpF porin